MANNTLDHLLEVEASAAAMVNDAQEEADRRIRENEEKNRVTYEERFKAEIHQREELLKKKKEETNEKYKKALDDYLSEISNLNADEKKFSLLFNRYLDNSYLDNRYLDGSVSKEG